jgi:hypothetical protein
MRQERTVQATIFEVFAQHDIGCELKAMSQWLDGQRELISLVAADLRQQEVRHTGRRGLPAESVLRCALLKQQRQLSYEELAFHLEDSASFRAFARLPLRWTSKKSALHHTIAAIRPETWSPPPRPAGPSCRGSPQNWRKPLRPAVALWRAEVDHYLLLIARVIAQTQRRVFDGEAVPASEKLVSLFEPHADIIVKSLPQRKPGAAARFNTATS